MGPLTDEEISAIRMRLNGRTPGAWSARDVYVYRSDDPGDRRQVCRIPTFQPDARIPHRDASFIASAPADIEVLLSEVDRLRQRDAYHQARYGELLLRVERALPQEADRNRLRVALKDGCATIEALLKSAIPNERDHPTMSKAWKAAVPVLDALRKLVEPTES